MTDLIAKVEIVKRWEAYAALYSEAMLSENHAREKQCLCAMQAIQEVYYDLFEEELDKDDTRFLEIYVNVKER